jgi:hypothetical protein
VATASKTLLGMVGPLADEKMEWEAAFGRATGGGPQDFAGCPGRTDGK